MSDPNDTAPQTTAGAPELLAPAVGILVVIVAVSSLLDDTGLLEHPWWVSLVVAATAAAIALTARTVVKLIQTT